MAGQLDEMLLDGGVEEWDEFLDRGRDSRQAVRAAWIALVPALLCLGALVWLVFG